MHFEDVMEMLGVNKLKDFIPYKEWECKRKLGFTTEVEAKRKVRKMKRDYRVYHCERCTAWHITSRQQ